MKVEYKDGADPGYGYLAISQAILPGEPWAIALQRASDKLFLTGRDANPWVGDRVFLPLSGTVQPDGSLHLAVGPGITDFLDQRDQYRIILQGEGQELPGRLSIGQITRSRDGSQHNTGQAPQAEPVTKPAQAAEPPVQPVARPEQPIQPAAPAQGPLEMGNGPAPAPKRRAWQWIILAVLILGCIAWYFLDQRNKTGEEAAAPQSEPARESPKPLGTEEQVRQFFREGKHSPKEAADLAAKLPRKTPQEQDAVYRLLYFAAENGEPSAYLPYGKILDPSTPANGSIEKNAPEAWAMYEKAQEAYPKESAEARAKLRQYLQELAAHSDEKARQWLLQIDQPR